MPLRDHFLAHLRRRLDDALPLRVVFWGGGVFDFAPQPKIAVKLCTPRLLRLFLTGDMAGRAAQHGARRVSGRNNNRKKQRFRHFLIQDYIR